MKFYFFNPNLMGGQTIDKVVVLAGGLGLRMQRTDREAMITDEQAKIADLGLKAMLPLSDQRPFLDYVLHNVAEAGFKNVCLVIGPDNNIIREYYVKRLISRKLVFDFAVQKKPLGTADAVAVAEDFVGQDQFLVLNADNLYPTEALVALRDLAGPGLTAFDPKFMFKDGKIPPQRFGVVEIDNQGQLRRIIEKPDEKALNVLPRSIGVNMNCWRFNKSIFRGCRAILPSPRGELELTDAVQYTIDKLGGSYRVCLVKSLVLDLSSRADIAPIMKKLQGQKINL